MSEKKSWKSEMSELAFSSLMMRERIAPVGSGASKGERLLNAALALRWKISRAKSVWYGDERVSIKPHELRKIEELSGVTYVEFIRDGKAEVRSVEQLINQADALLDGADEDFYRPFLAALRAVARIADRTRTSE